jgi:ABC-2 type transporter
LNIITTIKELAVAQNKIVLMTIHQPRTDIMNMLDKIVLLSMGKCAWFGSNSEALEHFSSLGYPIPSNTNPSDFFLDITTLDQRSDEQYKETESRITKFVESYETKFPQAKQPFVEKDQGETKIEWPMLWLSEFLILMSRNMKDTLRDKATIGATLGQSVFLVIIIGFIFFRLDNDMAGIQSKMGFLFFMVINQTFGIVMPMVRDVLTSDNCVCHPARDCKARASRWFLQSFFGFPCKSCG